MAADHKHVPAWKRVGLKLKYANDTAETPARDPDTSKRPASDLDSRVTSKRRKISPESTPLASDARRKSVTFTPDTKTEDGFSASRIFKQWMTPPSQSVVNGAEIANETSHSLGKHAQLEESPSGNNTRVEDQGSTSPTSLSSQERPSKKEKKKKTKAPKTVTSAKPGGAPDSNAQPVYLQYLRTFHSDKASWKFNKKHQTDLLKHCLDIQKVPSEYDPALKTYIAGLQGASALKRLKETAEIKLQEMSKRKRAEDIAGMDEPGASDTLRNKYIDQRVKHYESLLDNGYQLNEEELAAMEQGKREEAEQRRADLLLEATLHNFLRPDQPQMPMPSSVPKDLNISEYKSSADGATHTKFEDDDTEPQSSPSQVKKKTRKSRTTEVSSNSSSSSDDSDTSDDSSSDTDSEDEDESEESEEDDEKTTKKAS